MIRRVSSRLFLYFPGKHANYAMHVDYDNNDDDATISFNRTLG